MSYTDTFAEAGNRIISKEFQVIRSVYVDLEFLQDLRIGSLLTHIESASAMQYFYSQLRVYNSRYDEHTSNYFPKLNITDENIDKDLTDKDKLKTIASISPMTSMFYNFNTILGMYVKSNKYTVEGDPIIRVFVNVHYNNYPQELLDVFKSNMESQFNHKVNVQFIKRQRYGEDAKFYQSMDVLFLYDLEGFINTSPVMSNNFVVEGVFRDKSIFAKPQINDKFSNLSSRDKEHGVDKMRDQLNLYCDFEYAPSEILMFNDQEGGN